MTNDLGTGENQPHDELPGAAWYPDPAGGGGLRYWDGFVWTHHVAPPPPPTFTAAQQTWKGAQIGRPASGPGALADPGRRLAAQLLDGLVLLPLSVILVAVTLLIVAPHFGPIFPQLNPNDPNAPVPLPGFIWLYVTLFACGAVMGLVMVAYQTIATAKYGRSLGKAWLHIRPVRHDLSPLGWGRSFARAAIYQAFWLLSWIGLLDPLWCLWDDERQCLHDKVADSIVINDLAPEG